MQHLLLGAFRSMGRDERDAYLAHLLRLSRDDRRLRFHRAMSDAALARHADAVFADPRMHVVGWFRDGVLRGAAEVAVLADADGAPAAAEAAFAVEAPFRRRGVGRELMHRAALFARNRQAHTLHIATDSGNVAMQRLAMRSGAVFTIADGDADGVLTSEPRTVVSLGLEALEERIGLAHFLWDSAWRGWIELLRGAAAPTLSAPAR